MVKFSLHLSLRGWIAACLCLGSLAASGQASGSILGSIAQGLPSEFEAHFFDVPLAVRVDIDGRYLGDAMVVLSRDERVQLLEFTDIRDSQEPPALRTRWQERLADGRPLGDCRTDCPEGLKAIHYSLVNSQLSLLTSNVEQQGDGPRYYALPAQGSYGLLLRNQLNLVGGEQGTTGRYAVQGQGSVGDWTALADAQVDRGSDQVQGTRHRLEQLYGLVEIYRNGVLINSQAVQPGLQTLDTRVLPSGIYEVEVRLLEDGQETSRTQEFVYKPSNWRNLDARWRYNVYLGQQKSLLSNWEGEQDGGLSAGVLTNYLLDPGVVLGLSAQHVDRTMQYGTSLDWDIDDRLKLYGNVYQTDGKGNGYDLQLIRNHTKGSLVLSHSRSRVLSSRSVRQDLSSQDDVLQTSLSLNHRVSNRSTATVRLAHSSGAASGLGIDLGWAFYGKVLGSDANWRLSLFDRPGSLSTGQARNRGVNLSLSMSLGEPGRRVGVNLGSRTSRDGGRDQNASLTYQQDVDIGAIRTVSGTATFDRYGMGLAGNAQFHNQYLYGDAYAQTSSYNDQLSAGLNMYSLVALGSGQMALSGQFMPPEAGLIVDVQTDLPELRLRADDLQGGSTPLRPGRNVIPVAAYKAGNVQVDFADAADPGAVIQPSSIDYHLNRGGVEYRELRVLRTVTVLGRLVDAQGNALSGVSVINHASRSVSEPGGYFAVQMSQSAPSLEIRRGKQALCLLELDLDKYRHEDTVVLAGDLSCSRDQLAQVGQSSKGGES